MAEPEKTNMKRTLSNTQPSVLRGQEKGQPNAARGMSGNITMAPGQQAKMHRHDATQDAPLSVIPKAQCLQDVTHSLAFVPGNVLVADVQGIIQYVTPQTLVNSGYDRADMIGRAMISFWDQPAEISRSIMTRLERDHFWQGEIKHKLKNNGEGQSANTGLELVALSMVPSTDGAQSFIVKIGHPIDRSEPDELGARLQQREMDLQALMDATPYVISIYRLSDLKYMEVNTRFCQRTGYTRQEVLGRSAMDLSLFKHVAERKEFARVFERDGLVNDMEIQFVSKTGEIIDAVISARRLHFQGEACGITSSMDVTELRRTQWALSEREANYRTILETAPYTIVINRLPDGVYKEVNQACCRRIGYTREELIGRTPMDLNLYWDPADRERLLEKLKCDGQVVGMEIQYRAKDGSRLESLVSAAPIKYQGEDCLLTMTVDITEQKQIQRELREREASYRTILETSPYSITIASIETGTYIEVNDAFMRRTGYSKEELIGRSASELNLYVTSEDHSRMLEALHPDGKVSGMEMNFRIKDGTIRESMISTNPIRYRGQWCLLSMIVDISALKEVQRTLAENEAALRSILDSVPYSISLSRISDATYLHINEGFVQNTGYTRAEVIGKTPMALNFFVDTPHLNRLRRILVKQGRVDGEEMIVQTKTGWVGHVLISARAIDFRGERCLLTIATNISHLKEIQRALEESEASYRTILESAPYSVMVIRLSDNCYMQVNEAFCRRTGYSREEVEGRTPMELGIFAAPTVYDKMLEIFHCDGRVESMELQFRAKDGRILESLFSVTSITYKGEACLLAMTVDISKQKVAERALRRSEQKYRNVLINMEEGYWEVDLKGNLTFVNDAESRIHRCPAEDLIGKNNRDYTSPETAKKVLQLFNTVFQTGVSAILHDYELIREDGSVAIVETSVSLHRDENGKPIGFFGIARDITEKKKAEKELEKYRKHLEEMVSERTHELESAQKELVKREKLSVLGQLTATVSHELRNPLGVIRSSNFFLQRKVGTNDEKIDKHFRRIEEQVNLCDMIVADLLEYTRGRNVTLENRPITPWLKALIEQLEETENICIDQDLSQTLPSLPHDQEKMRRVCINLIENAMHAVRAKAEVCEKTGEDYQSIIRVTTTQTRHAVVIEVCDNGVGMDKNTCEHAFEPLFTTRARGTGIGLANVQKIVSEHDGEVSLASAPGKGTTVIVKLPCNNAVKSISC